MAPATPRPWLMMAGFACASLLAIAFGAITMAAHDIPAARWVVSLVGWAIGAVMALGLARIRVTPARLRVLAAAGAMAVVGSLAGPEQSGVHRWIGLGPLTIYAAALALPATLAAIVRLGLDDRASWIVALAIGLALLAQPDVSQSAAFTIGILIVAFRRNGWRWAIMPCLLAGLTAATALRPDPLQPVAEVEQIISMAWQASPLLAIAMIAVLAGSAATFLLSARRKNGAWALAAYAAVAMIAPLFGWFPVPLAGSGMSFPIGLWLGAAVLTMSDQSFAADHGAPARHHDP